MAACRCPAPRPHPSHPRTHAAQPRTTARLPARVPSQAVYSRPRTAASLEVDAHGAQHCNGDEAAHLPRRLAEDGSKRRRQHRHHLRGAQRRQASRQQHTQICTQAGRRQGAACTCACASERTACMPACMRSMQPAGCQAASLRRSCTHRAREGEARKRAEDGSNDGVSAKEGPVRVALDALGLELIHRVGKRAGQRE